VWYDRRAKEIIISFRGTTFNWQDFATDMFIIQEPLDLVGYYVCVPKSIILKWYHHVHDEKWLCLQSDDNPTQSSVKPLVHAGFKKAFMSIRKAVHQLMNLITRHDITGWTIYVTGHSLGVSLLRFSTQKKVKADPLM